ncbi:MAG: hypothetical protein MUE61_07375 [Vicinamibacterales bacterium]|nr:hypothetical protein [Vicinamibacterales bacterium]
MPHRFSLLTLSFLLATAGLATPRAASDPGLRPAMEVLVGGSRLPSYAARGTVYIEALKGREYEIRLRNPYPVRVAVALSVDGLNTIDARHTSAAAGRKWVLGPYETITISGWQTSMTHARRFEFTSEEQSYGAWLGKTNDLGVISAVFFRERVPERTVAIEQDRAPRSDVPAPAGQNRERSIPAAEAGAASPVGAASKPAAGAPVPAADEYAATGIGRRTEHAVRQVFLDLEPTPAASVSIRYEYRAQLVRLGVLPPVQAAGDPLDRRERARGFDGRFCPEPKR